MTCTGSGDLTGDILKKFPKNIQDEYASKAAETDSIYGDYDSKEAETDAHGIARAVQGVTVGDFGATNDIDYQLVFRNAKKLHQEAYATARSLVKTTNPLWLCSTTPSRRDRVSS